MKGLGRRGKPTDVLNLLLTSLRQSSKHLNSTTDHFYRPNENDPSTAPILVTPLLNMQGIRISILRHVRVSGSAESWLLAEKQSVLKQLSRQMCSSTVTCPDQIMDQVIGLVKKFDKIDASKVTETADFQKDLSLDSLDRVELVMAFEQEFSLDIPDEKADKLTCCADVANYIVSGAEQKVVEES